jgi:glycine oxidase
MKLSQEGYDVTLFDKEDWHHIKGCSYSAAGMIAPYCEMETAEFLIARIGLDCYYAWKDLIKEIDPSIYFTDRGSLVVAHVNHGSELDHLKHRISAHPLAKNSGEINADQIAELEPELSGRFQRGLYYPLESNVDNRGLMEALARKLMKMGVKSRMQTLVNHIEPGKIRYEGGEESFRWVVDARGLGARDDLPDLRGVRGELVVVHAKDVNLSRPIRLMHPRYPVYVVPHGDNHYFIGATAIESEDPSAITVRTTLELLSAAYIVHPGFAEARIVETVTNLRPTFLDNTPQIRYDLKGLITVNGMYRHGFLMSPQMSTEVVNLIKTGKPETKFPEIFPQISHA